MWLKNYILTYEMKPSVCAVLKQRVLRRTMPLAFNELDQRGRTLGVINWDVSFTPHRVAGRADTGAESWLYDMWMGKNTRGHDIGRFRITVDEVPDHIYSKKQKSTYRQWIEYQDKLAMKKLLEKGEARYYGLFQRPQGCFI